MGSTSGGSPNPWTPYDSFKECAQGLCNIYCPQWCSYPPPDPDPGDDSGTTFSPLIIAVIGILASAFLLVSYYAIITKYCRRRGPRNPNIEFQGRHHQHDEHDEEGQIWQQVGLDEALINSITVFKYKKGDRLVEGTECSVCLNEFQENENLRLLPKCCHAFHPSCIDVWLKSHTNCPMCRANAVPTYSVLSVPPPPPSSQTSSVVNTSAAPEIRSPQHDLIFIVEEEDEGRQRSHISNGESFFASNVSPKSPLHSNTANSVLGNSETRNNTSAGAGLLLDEERLIRRSISLGTFSSQRSSLLVADILKIEEDDDDNNDEDFRDEVFQSDTGVGSSEGNHKSNSIRRNPELCRAPATVLRRSFSTGRFYFHKTS